MCNLAKINKIIEKEVDKIAKKVKNVRKCSFLKNFIWYKNDMVKR